MKQTIYRRKELIGVKRLQKMPKKINFQNSTFTYSHKEPNGVTGWNYYFYDGNPYDLHTTQLVVI